MAEHWQSGVQHTLSRMLNDAFAAMRILTISSLPSQVAWIRAVSPNYTYAWLYDMNYEKLVQITKYKYSYKHIIRGAGAGPAGTAAAGPMLEAKPMNLIKGQLQKFWLSNNFSIKFTRSSAPAASPDQSWYASDATDNYVVYLTIETVNYRRSGNFRLKNNSNFRVKNISSLDDSAM